MGSNRPRSRRTVLSTVGASCVASVAGCSSLLSRDPVSIEWATSIPRDRNSFTVDGGTIYVGTVSGLVTVDAESGETNGHQWLSDGESDIYGRPVVDDGVAYYGTIRDGKPTSTGFVYAVDDNANERWKTAVPGSVIACAVGDELVYAATDVDGENHGLYAFDTESGDVVWDVDLDDYPPTSSPIFHDGRVLLQSGGIASFDAETGKLNWRYEVDVGSPWHAPVTLPAVDESLCYCLVDEDPSLLVVDLETGDPVWEIDSIPFASPAARDGVVYVGSVALDSPIMNSEPETAFYAFDVRATEELWRTEIGQSASFGPDLTTDTVYTTAGIGHDTLYALERESGTIRWEREFEHSISQPVIVDDRLYVTRSTSGDATLLGGRIT